MGFHGGFGGGAPSNPLQAWARSKAPAPPGGAPAPGGAPGVPHPGAVPGAPPGPPAATYPPGHQPGKVTPKGGASCSNCKFGMEMGDKTYCNEPNFVKFHGSSEVPSSGDSYVSDWWTDKAGAPAPGAAPEAPGAAPHPPTPPATPKPPVPGGVPA
jgi:hypothetical protein